MSPDVEKGTGAFDCVDEDELDRSARLRARGTRFGDVEVGRIDEANAESSNELVALDVTAVR